MKFTTRGRPEGFLRGTRESATFFLVAALHLVPLIAGKDEGRPSVDLQALANEFPASSTDTVVVSGMAELERAVNAAPPGRHVLIAPGTYAGSTLTFTATGTEANPIVVRPRDGIGTVTIDNANWTLAEGSSRLVLAGLYFNSASISVNGVRHRITRCRFRRIDRTVITVRAATDTRIDHCDFSDYPGVDRAIKCIGLASAPMIDGTLRRVLVDYCYFHDINPAVGRNGSELVGTLDRAASGVDPEMIVDHCLFRNISIPNEGEIFQSKMLGLVTRFCTFENMRMYNNLARLGANYELRSCWHENMMGVNVWGDDHLVVGNRFVGEVNMRVGAGDLYWKGALQQGKQGHFGSRRARVVGNRMGSGHIQVGGFWSRGGQVVPALDNNLHGNTRDGGGDAHTLDPAWQRGTSFEVDNEPYVPAVKLTPDDVGLFAPDPPAGAGSHFTGGGNAAPASTERSAPASSDVSHLANGFPVSSADRVVVASMEELERAVNAAPPGRHILIAPGTYAGGTLTFTAAGTEDRPIVIGPQGARGSVTLDAPTWTLAASTARLVFRDFHLINPRFYINGSNHRITRCRWRRVNRTSMFLKSRNTRIDHCDVSDYINNKNEKRWISIDASDIASGAFYGLLFDHNYFHDIDNSSADGGDGFLHTTGGAYTTDAGLIVERSLWHNVDTRARWLVQKTSDTIVRFCTFSGTTTGYLQQRQGGGWEVRSCWFEGTLSTNALIAFDDKDASPTGRKQLVIGNRFVGDLGLRVGCGNTEESPGPGYHASYNGRIIGNILDNGTIVVGWMWSSQEKRLRAAGNVLESNIRNGAPATTSNGIVLDFEIGTTIRPTTSESFVPAVKLMPADVGMGAPDPLCPEGPQS